jgi:hypothetical protein
MIYVMRAPASILLLSKHTEQARTRVPYLSRPGVLPIYTDYMDGSRAIPASDFGCEVAGSGHLSQKHLRTAS